MTYSIEEIQLGKFMGIILFSFSFQATISPSHLTIFLTIFMNSTDSTVCRNRVQLISHTNIKLELQIYLFVHFSHEKQYKQSRSSEFGAFEKKIVNQL